MMTTGTVIGISAAAIVIFVILLIIFFSARRRGGSSSGSGAEQNAQVYVGNLSYRVRERDLRSFFENFGEIAYIKVVKDRQTGRSKGFGFVTFETSDQADAALSAHGEEMAGRNIVVRIAKERA